MTPVQVFLPSSLSCSPSSKFRSPLVGLLLTFALLVPAFGQQSASMPPDHQGGGKSNLQHAAKVPFKRGPFGPDGKVYQVVPKQAQTFPNETETPQIREARALAESGIFNLTTKQPSATLSSQQLSLLHWNPSKLNVAENPLLGNELLKQPVEPAAKTGKNKQPASVPLHGRDFSGIGATGYFPPDGGVAAGPVQVVEVVNSNINVYDKNGNLLSSQTLNNFFSSLGTAGSDYLFDPSIYYDFLTGRFWVLATSENDNPNRSNLLVAVTATSDVTQGWYEYYLDATQDGGNSSSNWCDYPHLGMDADAIYISCDQFAFPRTGKNGGSFQYAKVRILSWDELTNDACCTWWDFWNLKEGNNNGSTSFVVRPALERFVGHGFGDYWVDAEGGGGSGSTIKVWQLQNPSACCDGSGGPTLVSTEQGVANYGLPPLGAQPLLNNQSVQKIDTGDTRILFAIYQFDHLSFGQGIACTQGGTTTDACAGFTEMDTTNYPSITNVNDWYYSQPAGEDVYFPFVDENINSDKTMVYSRSDGSSVYPGAYYTTIPNPSTCTFCTGGETTMQAGSATYVVDDNGNNNRWGDYHGAGTDPDLLGIWVEGEYTSSLNTWSTEVQASYNSYYPIDSASPGSLPFGNQAVFSSAATQYVTFTNTGNATMYTNSTYISGDGDFYITYDGCNFVTLLPGASCQEGVSFYPTSVGGGSAFIVVLDNSPASFADSTLTGSGVQAGTSTSLGSNHNPSTYGQAVTFTAQVVSQTSGNVTGSVTFYDGGTSLGTSNLSAEVAQITTAALSGGGHTISAVYNGSTLFKSSSTAIGQTVNGAQTSSTVVSSLNPSTYSNKVTFTASVSSGAGTPGGAVNFKDGGVTIGSGTLAAGNASFSTTTLSGGPHSITAVYAGTANFATSTSNILTQNVNLAGSTTGLTSSVNPSSYNQTVTFTAKVTSADGVPAGNVTFKNGAATLGSVALNGSGVATLPTTLTVGTHSITAVYAGNADFKSSVSGMVSQVVNKAKTTATVTSTVNPSAYHQFVALNAHVVGAFGGQVFGTVTFKSGTTTLGTGLLNASGIATLSTNTLAVAGHPVTAVYGGNGNYQVSTSPILNQTVNKATTKTNLVSSKNPSTHGTAVTFTATVVPAFGGAATGKVTFKNGTVVMGTGTINASNKAALTTSALTVGTHSITAVYPGDVNTTTSTSLVVKQVVK